MTIRRTHIFEDGYAALNSLGSSLKSRIRISFVNAEGLPEPGIDGGGVFKEFITEYVLEGDALHLALVLMLSS